MEGKNQAWGLYIYIYIYWLVTMKPLYNYHITKNIKTKLSKLYLCWSLMLDNVTETFDSVSLFLLFAFLNIADMWQSQPHISQLCVSGDKQSLTLLLFKIHVYIFSVLF
jgi:hypothetical protein